jgi:hypothetical protein
MDVDGRDCSCREGSEGGWMEIFLERVRSEREMLKRPDEAA